MSLVDEILRFDGKRVDEMKAAIANNPSDDEWHAVVSYFVHPEASYQVASTWSVKCALEADMTLPTDVCTSLVESAGSLVGWEPKLHLLQCVRYLDLKEPQMDKLLVFAHACATNQKVLVRVWSLDAIVRLGLRVHGPTEPLGQRILSALEDKAASMRARARNLLKEFPELESFNS